MSSEPAVLCRCEQGPAIEVRCVSKVFANARVRPMDASLREQVTALVRRPWQFLPGLRPRPPAGDIRALNEVSFRVAQGEKLGIIGRNGSGKSTLLKILARITPPTSGEVLLRGRVASILEVGTGFHPELTGHENIYLNGAILGLRRREIRERLPDIVAFAGIGDFLDLPVKRYSSGMYVRLAFSVAAHIDADILLVDEVLAVGDEGFREKCLARMDDAARRGTTILFVSHEPVLVRGFCSRCLVLSGGSLILSGDVEQGLGFYHTDCLAGHGP